MKIKGYWLISLLIMELCQAQAQQKTAQNMSAVEQQYQQLAWLTGTWNRVRMKPGRTAYERWEKAAAYSMKGRGVTHRENDTLVTETLQLVIKDSSIWYVADVPENKGLVWFRLTAIGPDGFTAENPLHDFPTKIIYRRDGDKLTATVSNQVRTLTFHFVRHML